MRFTIAIDPGIRGCGCAVFRENELIDAAYVTNPEKTGHLTAECVSMARAVRHFVFEAIGLPAALTVVLEWPRAYQPGKQTGDQNDLLPLAGVDGAIAALLGGAIITVHPDAWKGQVPKDVMNARVLERLTAIECARLPRKPRARTYSHDMLDAVGVGLHHLGRLERKRVIA